MDNRIITMPSIYTQLKSSDRKFIRREKARIRKQFLDFKKQEELITELYKKILNQKEVNHTSAQEKKEEPKKVIVKKEKTKIKKAKVKK